MPLVRFGVKNEYKLGVEELYKEGVQSEDPKAVLDGVAVAGLVGVLRQLGDLAQFAAEVFHGLQEQVASTSSRSRKLASRVQRIEASLPSLEKAILSQTDHLRFAYTPGCEVHACIRIERNHFICDDLPHFVMDSYEEFDSAGPGSCLKRYSDPTFFKRASSVSEVSNSEKTQRERKARKIKKRRSSQQSGHFPKSASTLYDSGRMQFSSTGHGQSSLSHTGSNFDMTFKSDLGDQSDSRGSKNGVDFIEFVSRPSVSSTPADKTKNTGYPSSIKETDINTNGSIYLGGQTAIASDDKSCSHDVEESLPRSSTATWDERLEALEPTDDEYVIEDVRQSPWNNSFHQELEFKFVNEKGVNRVYDLSELESSPTSKADEWNLKTSDGNFIEPTRDEVQDSHTTNFELQEHYLEPSHHFEFQREHYMEPPHLESCTQVEDLSEANFKTKDPPEPITGSNLINDSANKRPETGDAQYVLEANSDVAEKELETPHSDDVSPVDASFDVKSVEWDQQESGTANTEHVSQVYAFSDGGSNVKVIEWNEQDLEPTHPEYISQEAVFSEVGNNVKAIEWKQPQLETVQAERIGEMNMNSEGGNGGKLIRRNQQELETENDEMVSQVDMFAEGEDTVQVIEWNEFDDIDSGTENFVDALNTIESESESDFETEMKTDVLTIAFKDELEENTVNDQMAEKSSHLESESQNLCISYECKEEGDLEDLERPTTLSSENMSSMDHTTWSSPLDRPTTSEPSGNTLSMDRTYSSPLERPTTFVSSEIMSSMDHTWSSSLEKPTTESSESMLSADRTWSSHDQSESAADQKLDVSTCLADEQPLETSQSATLSVAPHDYDNCTDDPPLRVDPAVSESAKSGSEALADERAIHAPDVSQETPAGSPTTYPLAFWTNGSLLGLAPSKPVVFSMPNPVDSALTSNGIGVGKSNNDVVQKVDGPVGVPPSSFNESEHGNKSDKYGLHAGSSNHLRQQRLEKTHDTSVGHDNSNSGDHQAIRDLINGDAMLLESKGSVGTNVKNVSSDATDAGEDRSSLLSVLSRGLLKNGLRRSGSLSYDDKHECSSPSKSNESDSRCQEAVSHPVPETNVVGKLDSPVDSLPPSPPLEHMKISFQPVDGLDVSRLKLKYPEGIDQYESTLDAFPSFQLVPESTKLQNDIGSDSDDDTFCRSYACMSDNSHSNQSDSDSEQWESGDSTESNDHTLYDGLHRISSTESASTSPQHEEIDRGRSHYGSRSVSNMHSLSDPSVHLPVLDAKNPFVYQEMKLSIDPGVHSSHLQKSAHELPPLPPLQWRVQQTALDEVEDNQDKKSDSLSQSFVPKLADPLIAHPAKVESAKLISTTHESTTIAKPKKPVEEQKFGQKQTYHEEKERKMDNGGDFLHQIRTKSYNLKRTEPTRPIYAPTTATSTKLQQSCKRQMQFARLLGVMMVKMIAGAIPDRSIYWLKFCS
ncbi:Protein SCAR1 [Bienertia sinuspersici]